MERVCFLLQVQAERLEEYRARHAEVWPDMLDALSRTGWRNYSLFLRTDGLRVGYLETDDFAAAQAAMEREEVNVRWQADMAPFFAPPSAAPDGRDAPDFERLEEVFHLA